MTPYGMVKRECANLQSDGSCLGIPPVCLTGQIRYRAERREKCLLAQQPMQRCHYFERVIMPMAHCRYTDPKLRIQYQEAVAKYSFVELDANTRPKEKGCPDCGQPIASRRRFCDRCKVKHRRETKRLNMRQKRGMSVDT